MKVYLLSFMFLFAVLLGGCVDYQDASGTVSLQVAITPPSELTGAINLEGISVSASSNGKQITALTDDKGVATFSGLVPEVYDISTSWEITAQQYNVATGRSDQPGGAIISGNQNAYSVFDNSNVTLSTNIISSSLVIGKIYYAGSKDINNRNYLPGRYFEIYNQSASAIDVSGLYIGLVESESTPAYTLDNIREEFADSVVLLKQVFRIPTTAPFYLSSGGSVLITNSAIDHTSNSTFENDLTGADFEAKDASGRTVNNPDISPLSLIYTIYPSISNMNLLQSGPTGIVIFRTQISVENLPKVYKYGTARGSQWLVLPKRYIIDGVDVVRNKTTGATLADKRLSADIDGGIIHLNTTTGYTGEVLVRKVLRRENGRILLQDTNNSSNDFQTSTTIKIRNYEE